MEFTATPHETFLLWHLLANGGGDFWSKLSQFSAGERKRLKDACLLSEEMRKEEPIKRGSRPKIYLLLTDKGWNWAERHLDAEISGKPNAVFLRTLLTRLKRFLGRQRVALADFIISTEADQTSAATSPATVENEIRDVAASSTMPRSIRAAYMQLSANRAGVRVRLADIRRVLSDTPREKVDSELMKLEKSQQIIIYPLDDPSEINEEDRAAALNNSTGSPRHIVYIER